MGNIIELLQEIFMMKENKNAKVGLSYLKESKTPVEQHTKNTRQEPKELRLSELMRRSSY